LTRKGKMQSDGLKANATRRTRGFQVGGVNTYILSGEYGKEEGRCGDRASFGFSEKLSICGQREEMTSETGGKRRRLGEQKDKPKLKCPPDSDYVGQRGRRKIDYADNKPEILRREGDKSQQTQGGKKKKPEKGKTGSRQETMR